MGLSTEDSRSTVRFSLSRFTTAGEIDRATALLLEIVPRAQRAAATT
jgi:cysteine sulfinate desulfinase/cysteine desulfurase-like protein